MQALDLPSYGFDGEPGATTLPSLASLSQLTYLRLDGDIASTGRPTFNAARAARIFDVSKLTGLRHLSLGVTNVFEGAKPSHYDDFSAALATVSTLTALHFATATCSQAQSDLDPTPAFPSAVRQLRNLQSLSVALRHEGIGEIFATLLPAARPLQQLTRLRLQLALDTQQPADAQIQQLMRALTNLSSLRRVELRLASEPQALLRAAPASWVASGDARYLWFMWDVPRNPTSASMALSDSRYTRSSTRSITSTTGSLSTISANRV
jgi:hypothetical protein